MIRRAIAIAILVWAVSFQAQASDYCFAEAAAEYQVPADWLWAIAKAESGFDPAAVNYNRGSLDFGVMQINSMHIKSFGLEHWYQLGDVCTNIRTGAAILADCLHRYGKTAMGVGCYNASSSDKRLAYARKIQKILDEAYRGQATSRREHGQEGPAGKEG